MVVDDDKNFLNSIGYILHSRGITNVECCQDSLEVMPLLEKGKYSCILLDLKMEGITGEELLKKIAAGYPEIPVIILTGINMVEIAVSCMKHGSVDYIVKPPDTEKLIETIQKALDSIDDHNLAKPQKTRSNDEVDYKTTIYFHKEPPKVLSSNEEEQEEEKDFLKSFFECGTLKIGIEKKGIEKKEIELKEKERLIFCYLAYKNYKTRRGGKLPNWISTPDGYKYRLSATIKKNKDQKPEWDVFSECIREIDGKKPIDQDIRRWKFLLEKIFKEKGIIDIIDSQKGRGKGYWLKGIVEFSFTL
ncbi:response regulator [Acidobacteriota bacterium]